MNIKTPPDALYKILAKQNTVLPERGPCHRFLSEFIGRWKVAGENAPLSPEGREEHVTGEDSYEWFEGEYFLVHRSSRKTKTSEFKEMGWIAYDAETEAYLSYSISNLGLLRLYQMEIEDGLIRFNSDTERGTLKLDKVGNTMTVHWEFRADTENQDQSQWQSLCDLKGRRLDS